MNEAQRAKIVLKNLDKIYPKINVPLKSRNVFTLLISVLLSAQCTDNRVNMVTPALFKLGPNASKMAACSTDEILECIKTCGLAKTKAKNIKLLSELLIKRHGGIVPPKFSELEALPGVGHKTASVVMSHAFKIPAFPVDTHIHRLAQRWKLTNGKSVEQTEKDLKKLYNPNDWEKLHLQIITYGREFCSARSCFGIECDICRACFPNRKNPVKTKKP